MFLWSLVNIMKLKFDYDVEAEVKLSYWNWNLVQILKLIRLCFSPEKVRVLCGYGPVDVDFLGPVQIFLANLRHL